MNIKYSIYSYIWIPKKVYYNHLRQYFQCMAQYGIYVLCICTFITLLLLYPNPKTQSPKQQFIKYWTRPPYRGHHIWTKKKFQDSVNRSDSFFAFCTCGASILLTLEIYLKAKNATLFIQIHRQNFWRLYFELHVLSCMLPRTIAELYCSEIFSSLSATTNMPS